MPGIPGGGTNPRRVRVGWRGVPVGDSTGECAVQDTPGQAACPGDKGEERPFPSLVSWRVPVPAVRKKVRARRGETVAQLGIAQPYRNPGLVPDGHS